MNTALVTKPVKYLKLDAEGNVYAIPENEEFAFTMAVEDIQNAEWGSLEWSQFCYDFELNFSQYKKD